jgi:membrane protein implicated in regulation of membrane protease activity
MISPRIVTNVILAALLLGAGLYLLWSGSLFLRDRWNPQVGTLFSGVSLYLLAVAPISLAAFSAAVARGWLRADSDMPEPDRIRPSADYKGRLIARYWYFVVLAVACLVAAFLLAARVPAP